MLARAPSSRCEGRELAISLSAVRRVRRLTQLRCWVVPGRDSSSSASSVRRVPSLHSKVEFNLAAIPPGTLVLTLRRQASKSLPGVQGTAVPAVGAEDAGQPPHNAAVKTVSLACTHPTPPVIHCAGRRSASVSVRHTLIPPAVPVREDRCTPHQRHLALTPVCRSGPGPGGSLPTRSTGLCRRPGA